MDQVRSSRNTVVCLCIFQVILIILFALFAEYAKNDGEVARKTYPMFQDVHVMIFVGFGFLMTFLKKYGFSSVGLSLLIAAIFVQWGILCHGFFRLNESGKILLDVRSLVMGDIIAATILISFGALLGKVSPIQVVIMGLVETVIFCLNEYIGAEKLMATDAGGSMYVHVFGAYFGLTVSLVLSRGIAPNKLTDSSLEASSYNSDILAMIGTVFLWVFWPSFNAALVDRNCADRAIINTYLSLCASCVITFATSALFNKENKFEMVHIQNATLAGGVCVGTAANLMLHPYGAIIVGTLAGCLSTVGFQFVQKYLLDLIKLHDTCGVNNLHGMPGITAGLIGAILASLATEESYGPELYDIFPALINNGTDIGYAGRTAATQAGFQLIALSVSFGFAVIGGLITGLSIRNMGKIEYGQSFDDGLFWILPHTHSQSRLTIKYITGGALQISDWYDDIALWDVATDIDSKMIR